MLFSAVKSGPTELGDVEMLSISDGPTEQCRDLPRSVDENRELFSARKSPAAAIDGSILYACHSEPFTIVFATAQAWDYPPGIEQIGYRFAP